MSSTHQTHTSHESKEDREFSFWGSPPNTISCEKNDCDQLGGNETRLLQRAIVSNPDPSSRSKAIEEGRKELMEMMQDMPESSYELSFQDMVVEQQQQQQEVPQPQPNSRSEAQQLQHKKLKKKKKKEKKEKNKSNNRPGQILRVESMDSETFLLKMFFPTSLDWMRKPKVQNGSKVSPKQVDKERKIKRFFTEQNTGSSSSSNNKSRKVDRSFSFSNSCWPFFHYIKSKTKKLGG